MQFFTTTRRGQIALAAGLLAGLSSLLAFFGLFALALVGIAGGIIVINLLIAENVHRSRLSAKVSATRQRQSSKGLNSSVARIEAALAELETVVSKTSGHVPKAVEGPVTGSSATIASASSTVEWIGRVHDFQQWWGLHAHLLGRPPQAAAALALPPVLSRLRESQTVLFVGPVATATWVYETLLRQQITLGRLYIGFSTADEREGFESFVEEKRRRLEHVSFVLDPAPAPAASMGGLPAVAVDLMLVDFGASEEHEKLLVATPGHYWRWLRDEAELVVLDSRQGLVSGATTTILDHCEDFVVAINSEDPYTRNLKRAAR